MMNKLFLIAVFGMTQWVAASSDAEVRTALYFEDTVVRHGRSLRIVLEFINDGEAPIKLSMRPVLEVVDAPPPPGFKSPVPLERKTEVKRDVEMFYAVIVAGLPEGSQSRMVPIPREGGEVEVPAKGNYFLKITLPQECFDLGACKIKFRLLKGSVEVAHTDEKIISCVADDTAPNQVLPSPAKLDAKDDKK